MVQWVAPILFLKASFLLTYGFLLFVHASANFIKFPFIVSSSLCGLLDHILELFRGSYFGHNACVMTIACVMNYLQPQSVSLARFLHLLEVWEYGLSLALWSSHFLA